MSKINQGASRVGTLEFENGNVSVIWMDYNRNNGSTIVWQHVAGRRPKRTTGRNIVKMLDELEEALYEGEARWVEYDDACLDALIRVREEQ